MAVIHTKRVTECLRAVHSYSNEVMDECTFMDDVKQLVFAVESEAELAQMNQKVRFLGEPYMLYRALESVVGMERQPVKRAAAIKAITDALSEYLGLKFTPGMRPRKRRGLLPHV